MEYADINHDVLVYYFIHYEYSRAVNPEDVN